MFRLRVLRPHDGTALVATLTGFFFALHASVALPAADCNQNGIEDVVDISQGAFDCNSNGVPDECEVKTLSETFLLPQEVFSPVEVYDIVAGDWNGDGQTDVAVLGIANLATLFGNGRGELTPGPILRAPTNAQGLLKGDFDGDTDVDLVTLNADSKNITLLMNHGGTFDEAGTFKAHEQWNDFPGAAAGDVDGDGDLDLVVGSTSLFRMAILLNDGTAQFAAPRYLFVGRDQRDVLAIDVDVDGLVDLLAAGGHGVVVLKGLGGGAFDAPSAYDDMGTPPDFVIGGPPDMLTPGDIDADGRVDLVIAERYGSKVTVLFNDGAGGFAERFNFECGEGVWGLSTADLDADGHLEVLSANSQRTVSVLWNRGQGERKELLDTDTKYLVGGHPIVALPFDIDSDGDPDIVTGSSGAHALIVLRNQGGRSFSGPQRRGVVHRPSSVMAIDADGDGDRDLLVTSLGSDSISMIENKGGGVLADAATVTVGFSTTSVQVADVNSDGVADLLLGFYNGAADVLLGTGHLSFGPRLNIGAAGAAVFIDIEPNGIPDVVFTNNSLSSLTLLRNNGNAEFSFVNNLALSSPAFSVAASDLDGDGDEDLAAGLTRAVAVLLASDAGSFAGRIEYPTNGEVFHLIAADLDGDGLLDLAGTGASGVSLLWNLGDARFSAATELFSDSLAAPFSVADVDGDAKLDVITVSSSDGTDSVVFFINSGERQFLLSNGFAAGTRLFGIAVADLDGSGTTDVAYCDFEADDLVAVLRGTASTAEDCNADGVPDECQLAEDDCDGNGVLDACEYGSANFQFGPADTFSTGFNPGSIARGDWNGDGSVDLAVASFTSSTVNLHLNDGSARLVPGDKLTVTQPTSVASADLEGDGDLDLVATSTDPDLDNEHHIVVFRNDGKGKFNRGDVLFAGQQPRFVIAPDLDGDGDPDLAVLSCSPDDPRFCTSSSVWVLLNGGNGAFSQARSFEIGLKAGSVTAADLDGDGDVDLAAAGEFNRLFLLTNDGSATFSAPKFLPAGEQPRSVLAADLDRDGDNDLAVAGWTEANVRVLLNNGGGSFPETAVYPAGVAPETLTAGDFDGDGNLDLAAGSLDEPNRGSVILLRNIGTGKFAKAGTTAIPGDPRSMGTADLDGDGDLDLYVASFSAALVAVLLNNTVPALSWDCNGNGVPDKCEISSQPSLDSDGNGVLDTCEANVFHRGDSNGDGRGDVSDAIFILSYLFLGSSRPGCLEAADVNNDGAIDISDASSLLRFLFLGGNAPPPPGPPSGPCGFDPDSPSSPRSLGCRSYGGCASHQGG